ncbi:TrbC/VirB2 family protein [Sphingomonas sp. CJ99]
MSFGDPMTPSGGTQSILAAAQWVEVAMLGSVATVVAIIAVAALGLALLSGRIDLRRAGWTLLGCFIVFGASTIAGALLGGSNRPSLSAAKPSQYIEPHVMIIQKQRPTYDPHAGASMPLQN